ncbi:hypothetical protein FNO38_10650 [Escherichia coli]|uniref:Uncharacterized protein n=1 Tax=Escherichia coli TaxID=562 RepID=A0A8S7IFH5_ECOLX|nr:hypothetical protein [Salmonella enterica subsp. enterica serovar Meleagridis]EFA3501135.1 hypothetical protein [Escherichia coli]EFB5150645.1 hypothetical protein [Escherichia coli]EFC2249808.1 hypothetical protein [Escherichia coli]NAQ12210.1 hypothetical protein [Escherichia coli]
MFPENSSPSDMISLVCYNRGGRSCHINSHNPWSGCFLQFYSTDNRSCTGIRYPKLFVHWYLLRASNE